MSSVELEFLIKRLIRYTDGAIVPFHSYETRYYRLWSRSYTTEVSFRSHSVANVLTFCTRISSEFESLIFCCWNERWPAQWASGNSPVAVKQTKANRWMVCLCTIRVKSGWNQGEIKEKSGGEIEAKLEGNQSEGNHNEIKGNEIEASEEPVGVSY